MSPGSRSLVNWTRANERSSDRASACASVVLPTPGTSSRSTCPPAARPASASSTISCLPLRARAMFPSSAEAIRRASCAVSGAPIGASRAGAPPFSGVMRARLTHASSTRPCQTAHPSMQAPTVTVTQRGAARARAGHPWIFRADVAQAPDDLVSGAEVRIADARKNFIARGFWAVKSPIALRVLSRQDLPLDEELLATRLRRAYLRRQAMFPGADAFRVLHGEADLMPGYFVDWYNGVAAVQHLS